MRPFLRPLSFPFSALLALLALASFAPALSARTVVVLPFANLSGDRNLDWVGESIGVTLQEALYSHGLLILGRDDRDEALQRLAIKPYTLLTRASVIKLGDELDSDLVLFGSFTINKASSESNARPSVRITARLLDLRKLRQSPELQEAGTLDELTNLQNHLAWQALGQALPDSKIEEKLFLAGRPKIRLDAMEQYVRGLLAPEPEQQVRFWTTAARLDPLFSAPAFELGMHYFDDEKWKEAAEWLSKVKAIDSYHREALFFLGLAKYNQDDLAGAEAALRTVAKQVPLNEVFNNLGAVLLDSNPAEALDLFIKASQGDEADADYHFNAGYALWKLARFDEAAARFRAVLDRIPDDQDATLLLGKCLKKDAPKAGEERTEGLARLKDQYEETAFRQLESMLKPGKR